MRTSFLLLLGKAAKRAGDATGGKGVKRILLWMRSLLHPVQSKRGELKRFERRSASAGPAARSSCRAGSEPAGCAGAGISAAEGAPAAQIKRPLAGVIEFRGAGGFAAFDPDAAWPARPRKAPPVPVGEGAFYLSRAFTCKSGTRSYKVYIPGHAAGCNAPLLVMLHGCAQDPDGFAIGTGMNLLAEEYGFIVAYPGQSASANQKACWNWFHAGHQMRGRGEPEIIAGITLSVLETFGADPGRVFVAGLSAGGAMAAVMGAAYPELYAAIGIHSGLAYGSAKDLASAYAAMRGSFSAPGFPQARQPRKRAPSSVRTIVFHGTSDRAVHPSNAGRIFSEARAALTGDIREKRQSGIARGRPYACTVIEDLDGVPLVEYWEVEGLGHAWSGGQAEGSHTDPRGPDASRELVRFFLAGKALPPRLRRSAE